MRNFGKKEDERKFFRFVNINNDIDKIESLKDIQDFIDEFSIKKMYITNNDDSILFHPVYSDEERKKYELKPLDLWYYV